MPNGEIGYSFIPEFETYKDLFIEKGSECLYGNLYEKLSMLDCRDKGSGLYQYDSLYLTSSKDKAKHYACRSFAGGELGLIAYRLLEGIEVLNFKKWKPDAQVVLAISNIKDFSLEGKEEPIVITLNNIDSQYLLDEDGRPITIGLERLLRREEMSGDSFRYIQDITLSLENAEYLKKQML